VSALFGQALATEGLIWLVGAVLVAGIVRGFSGFGTAMIYMPVASSLLSPVQALITLLVFDLFGPLPNVPRALRDGQPREVGNLALGAVITLPLGIWFLTRVDPLVFRWLVSTMALIALTLPAFLLLGWRHQMTGRLAATFGVGAFGGFLAGFSGLAGPPVIIFYLSSKRAVASVRANILLYLLFVDVLAIALFAYRGLLDPAFVMVGAMLAVPYTIGNVAGAAIFDPDKAKAYRVISVVVIALSALKGLPVFG